MSEYYNSSVKKIVTALLSAPISLKLIKFNALFILPVLMLVFSLSTSLINDNLTGLETTNYVLYCLCTLDIGLGTLFSYEVLLNRLNIKSKFKILALVICIGGIVFALLPYSSQRPGSLLSNLHVFFALFSSVGIFVLTALAIFEIQFRDYQLFKQTARILLILCSLFVVELMLIGAISGLLEVNSALGLNWLLLYLIHQCS